MNTVHDKFEQANNALKNYKQSLKQFQTYSERVLWKHMADS